MKLLNKPQYGEIKEEEIEHSASSVNLQSSYRSKSRNTHSESRRRSQFDKSKSQGVRLFSQVFRPGYL